MGLPNWPYEKGQKWNKDTGAHADKLISDCISGTEAKHEFGKSSHVYQGDNDNEIRANNQEVKETE